MEISSPLTGAAAITAPVTDKARISSDFDTFLKMLTAQIQNQDPLNPIDSADYAVQLATFSSVEQQTLTNQKLDSLAGLMNVQGMAQLASWVGQEARSAAKVYFSGSPISLSPAPLTGADQTVLVATAANGTIMARQQIPASTSPYSWAGLDMTGAPLPPGPYLLSLESYRAGQIIGTSPIEHYARIEEVQNSAEGPRLILTGGIAIAAENVTSLRGVN